MVNLKNVVALGGNGTKKAIALVASIAVAELGVIGAKALEGDAKSCAALAKHYSNPTPVKVKKGFFKKSEVVTINPVTGTMKSYTGTNKPVNKKALKLKKVN